MRTIKFRGKRILDGKWIYGVPYLDGGWHIMIDSNTATPEEGTGSWSVDPSTVGQFTGLTDKNGTEIYEGDIIAIRCFTAPAEVYMDSNGFWAFMTSKNEDGFMLFDYTEETDCIGNIHDNPELLKNE